MIVAGIQRTSTIDFPGTLSCVLFTRGCDMDCFYCHNRDLIGPGDFLPTAEVDAFLEKRRGLLEGVVVSGGEPTLQPDLREFLQKLRGMDYRIKLDTNGRDPSLVLSLLEDMLLDYVAVDFKAPQEKYAAVCAAPGGYDSALTLIRSLSERNAAFEARTTLYPGLTAGELLSLAGKLPLLPRYRLNFFRMPEHSRAKDQITLARHTLTPAEIRAVEPELRRAQPNLIF